MKQANLAGAAAVFALLTSTAPPADALDLGAPLSAADLNHGLVQLAAAIKQGTTAHHLRQGAVHNGAQGTTVHPEPRGAVRRGPRATTVHPGQQGATHHATHATTARHGAQAAHVHGRPGAQRPYRPTYRPAYRQAVHPAYRPPSLAKPPSVVYPAPAPANPPAAAVWTRPGWYHWSPGGAVAAGVAKGFLSAAAVTAWAPPPPKPGLCWYYTEPSQRNGFWDVCP